MRISFFWQDTTLFNKFIISFLALSVAPILSPFFLFSSFLYFLSRLVSSCLLTHYLPHYPTTFFFISPSFSFISHNLPPYLDHHFLPPPSFIFSAILPLLLLLLLLTRPPCLCSWSPWTLVIFTNNITSCILPFSSALFWPLPEHTLHPYVPYHLPHG